MIFVLITQDKYSSTTSIHFVVQKSPKLHHFKPDRDDWFSSKHLMESNFGYGTILLKWWP